MNYYHGSNKFFKEFDLDKCNKDFYTVVHLTPHKQYAINFANNLEGPSHLYEVSVKGQETIEYREFMMNQSYASLDKLKIVKIIDLNGGKCLM